MTKVTSYYKKIKIFTVFVLNIKLLTIFALYYWWSINTIDEIFDYPIGAELHFQSDGIFLFKKLWNQKNMIII